MAIDTAVTTEPRSRTGIAFEPIATASAIAIDLEPTAMRVGCVDAVDGFRLLPDRHDRTTLETPSLVGVIGDRHWVGDAVWELLESDPGGPFIRFSATELMAGTLERESASAISPTEACTLLLEKARLDAEASLRRPVRSAVLAVASSLGEDVRAKLQAAASRAGFATVELVDANLAALDFLDSRVELGDQTLCMSLHGGVPEVALIANYGESLRRVAAVERADSPTACSVYEAMADSMIEGARLCGPLRAASGARLRSRVSRLCEELCKRIESGESDQASLKVFLGDAPVTIRMSRGQLEESCKPLVDVMTELSERCLSQHGASWEDLDSTVLLGPLVPSSGIGDLLISWGLVRSSGLITLRSKQAVIFGALQRLGTREEVIERDIPRSYGIAFRSAENGGLQVAELVSSAHGEVGLSTGTFGLSTSEDVESVLRLVAWGSDMTSATCLGEITLPPATSGIRDLRARAEIDQALVLRVEDTMSDESWSREFPIQRSWAAVSLSNSVVVG